MAKTTRRTFLTALPTAALALGGLPVLAQASKPTVKFAPGVIEDALDSGRTVIVTFHAFWCAVCKRQMRVIDRLREESRDFDKLYFVNVDWDEFRNLPVAIDRMVFNRSTMLVLKGTKEVDRVVAATSRRAIEGFLRNGVAAVRIG